MFDCIEAWRQRNERRTLIVGKSVVAAALIAGCSWVPDAVNPVEWYKGISDSISSDEHPDIAAPRRPDGKFPDVNQASDVDRNPPPGGLTADHENSKYAQPARREPTPTKQLARRQPAAPPATQLAQAPAAPAPAQVAGPVTTAPAQGGKGSYQPSLDHRMQTARDEGPSAPPRTAPGGPPPRADIPDSIPTRRTVLSEQYQRRLAESAAATNKNDPFATVPPARPESSYNLPVSAYAVPASAPIGYARVTPAADYGETAPRLVPPRGVRGARGAVIPSGPAASFEVADVQFAGNGGLTAADHAALKDVAALQRQTGGVIRIVGLAPSGAVSFADGDETAIATQRANAVARALTHLGVPARKVLVAADPAAGGYDDAGAKVSIEY